MKKRPCYVIAGEYLEGQRRGQRFYFYKSMEPCMDIEKFDSRYCWKDHAGAVHYAERVEEQHAASRRKFNSITPCKFYPVELWY